MNHFGLPGLRTAVERLQGNPNPAICPVCHDPIGTRQPTARYRGLTFHRRCAAQRLRMDRSPPMETK